MSLALLGLSAIDPIGIAIMPILLLQPRPYRRSLIFLCGSFVSLFAMGIIFAHGFGALAVQFQNSHAWVINTTELATGAILLLISAVLWYKLKHISLSVEPSASIISRLQLRNGKLFVLGATLVAVQSIVDAVFAVAMIHLGQLAVPFFELTVAVTAYAIGALGIQLAVVAAYWLTPPARRQTLLTKVNRLLARYSYPAIIVISALLGGLLVALDLHHR